MIEGVCGDGSLGDIAIDDISLVQRNCSQVHNGTKLLFRGIKVHAITVFFIPFIIVSSLFCSFQEECGWILSPGVWEREQVRDRSQFMLQGAFRNLYKS